MINILYWGIAIIALELLFLNFHAKWIAYYKKNTKLFCLICVVLLVALSLVPVLGDYISNKKAWGYTEYSMVDIKQNYTARNNVGEIYGDKKIEQSFHSDYEHIKDINIYTQMFGRKNVGCYFIIDLIDKTEGKKVQHWEQDLFTAPDEDYLKLELDNPLEYNTKDKDFVIRITSRNAESKNCGTVVYMPDQYDGGMLYIDENETDYDLVFSVTGYSSKENKEFVRIKLCALLMVLTLVLFFNHIEKMGKIDCENS